MRGKLFLLSITSAILLTAAWPPYGFAPLLFVALIPLLQIQHIISNDNRLRARHLFFYAYLTFLLWNLCTTWWVWFASGGGATLAITVNALLMAFVFLIYHKVKRNLPERIGAFVFIPIWISFEFLHLDWDLSWPWLTLGNGLANNYTWLQWYEYTGVFGGSLWILLINVILFQLYIHRNTLLRETRLRIIFISSAIILFIIPIITSLIIYHRFDVKADPTKPINVVVVQPNVDPYKKFNGDYRDQLENMIALAQDKVDSNTDYLVFPETALTQSLWDDDLKTSWSVARLHQFIDKYPKLKLVTGATTGHEYRSGEQPSVTVRYDSASGVSYDIYNTALQFDSTKTVQQYHKSKLVPGVERMPFPGYLHFLEKLAINMGGSTGSLGMQDTRTVFVSANDKTKVAPVVCYESIYGDYVGEYIRNGADYIFIITNDGWWGDTPGYKQHLLYGRLRAIETRKSIARSANTGISCFIDQRGDFYQRQNWWTASSIKMTLNSTAGMTFYTRHGDYIARAMLWLSIGAILIALYRVLKKKYSKG
ncbi:MAG TPA: apolipoprotein N-acyltransferase [Bacteroidia bacterium]|jgi:apolipoprotein N-acyltransferase|nr:apolipoprotein N-acyltransferase [Bacteroidia bacterium]